MADNGGADDSCVVVVCADSGGAMAGGADSTDTAGAGADSADSAGGTDNAGAGSGAGADGGSAGAGMVEMLSGSAGKSKHDEESRGDRGFQDLRLCSNE